MSHLKRYQLHEANISFLFGQLMAHIIVFQSQEEQCSYRETKVWKFYESDTTNYNRNKNIKPQFLLRQAENILFQQPNQPILNLLKQIAPATANTKLPSYFNHSEFALGFWGSLPEEKDYDGDNNSDDSYNYDDYEDDDSVKFAEIINKYPGAIPADAMNEVPYCYLPLVDDGQYC